MRMCFHIRVYTLAMSTRKYLFVKAFCALMAFARLCSALVAHGISRHELDHVLYGDPHPHKPPHTSMQRLPPSPHISTDNRSSRGVTVVSKPDIHHAHRSNWYVNCSRTEAISILQKCEDGTFLLRPGSQDNHPFSLSIV